MGLDSTLKSIPLVGESIYDIRQGIHGNPDAIKAAYDAQIAASKEQSEAMKQFLLGQKGQAQAFYGPLQHMYQSSYGTEGLQSPQIPQSTAGMSPLASMYGKR